MEIHQALTRSPTIRNILCRHEQVALLQAMALTTCMNNNPVVCHHAQRQGCPMEPCHSVLNNRAVPVQGEIFAAEGYGKVTGEVGVCIATSGPGATNLVTGLADALLDSVPMVAITGQV